ncbi:MAG: hypothetical protein H3C30_13935 [Candidatus Hydrogenedentes bacterium]|nr:hypothetical protein [Candidatus Hydrogenedentota bacterium]
MAGGNRQQNLDALIERALGEERPVPVPVTLLPGVRERLRVAALRDRERVRFRLSMLTLLLALCSALVAAFFSLWFTKLSLIASVGVSGGKGQYDYYATALGLLFGDYRGAYSLLASLLLAAVTLLLGVKPLRRYLDSH